MTEIYNPFMVGEKVNFPSFTKAFGVSVLLKELNLSFID